MNFPILQEKSLWKTDFFQNFKGPLFFNGWLHGCQFRPALRHLSVLSKKCSFATLVNMRQTLWHLNVKSSLKLNGLWKLYGSFKYSSWLSSLVFQVLNISHNFVSTQMSLFANNCWSEQNYEKCQMWPNFYFYWSFRNI